MSISPLQFMHQVKQEVKKVTWPTRKEVIPACIMVVILVSIAAAFLFVVDMFLGWGVGEILQIGK